MVVTVFCICQSVKRLGDYVLFEISLLIRHLSVFHKSLHLQRKLSEKVSVYLEKTTLKRPFT